MVSDILRRLLDDTNGTAYLRDRETDPDYDPRPPRLVVDRVVELSDEEYDALVAEFPDLRVLRAED